jgi:hypothetical protein
MYTYYKVSLNIRPPCEYGHLTTEKCRGCNSIWLVKKEINRIYLDGDFTFYFNEVILFETHKGLKALILREDKKQEDE